jgi:prepilin-type N-terminal cleavage/methylation domain
MINNQKGFSLIEVLVALVIGCVTAYAASSYLTFMAGLNEKMKLRRVTGNAVHSFAEGMRFNMSLYQVTFDNSPAVEANMLDTDNLPLGISKNNVVPRSACATQGCQAFLGYVIMPSIFIRNLYELKFRIVSPDGKVTWEQNYNYYITNK